MIKRLAYKDKENNTSYFGEKQKKEPEVETDGSKNQKVGKNRKE